MTTNAGKRQSHRNARPAKRAGDRAHAAAHAIGVSSQAAVTRSWPGRRSILLIALALVAITAIAYAPVWHNGFVSYDDGVYVSNNAHVKAGLSWGAIAWAFTTRYANFWHPLTWLSLLVDVQLFGVNPGPLHLSSLLLHIVSTLLLFLVLLRATGARFPSAFVAALFAVHPLHVESVAWIAERKDALSTVFSMLALLAYVGYARAPHWPRYVLVVVCFALGLMAKPMLVTLPFVLLLLDVWPLGRLRLAGIRDQGSGLRALIWGKVPLFALAAGASVLAYFAQGTAVATFESIPFTERVANALVAYVTYVSKTVWPTGLMVFYPYAKTVPVWPAIGSLVVLAAVSVFVVRQLRRRPYLAVGWFWYLGTLFPVIGLIQVGSHAMADRYTYVPLIGLFIIVAWGVPDLLAPVLSPSTNARGSLSEVEGSDPRASSSRVEGRWRMRRVVMPVLAAIVIVGSVATTRAQVMTWRDSVALWRHALNVMPDNSVAHCGLGRVLDAQGRFEEAFTHLRESARLAPGFAEARNSLGRSLLRQGRLDEAIEQYFEAVRLAPANTGMRSDLALALEQRGRFEDAAGQYQELLASHPEDAETHDKLGHVLANRGQIDEAMAEFREALRLRPDYAPAHDNLGNALAGQGRMDEAIGRFREALRLDPDYPVAHENLGRALASQGKWGEAIEAYSAAVRLAPDSPDTRGGLGSALAAMGRTEEAIAQWSEALRLRPDRADLHDTLGFALAGQGKTADAIAHFSEAVRLQPGSEQAHLYLGIALAATGRGEEGAAHLNEALRINPNNDAARRALESIRQSAAKRSYK